MEQLMKAAAQGCKDEQKRIIEIIKQPFRMKPNSFPNDAQKEFDEAVKVAGFEAVIEVLIASAIMQSKKQIIKDIKSGKFYEELEKEKGWADKSKGWAYYED